MNDIRELDHISINFTTEFANRQIVSRERLLEVLSKIDGVSVAVVGDLIVDEYVTCEPLGMSQEDASIVVTPIDSQRFLGGAGIVAAHASNLGAQAKLYSVIGDDDIGNFAMSELENSGVTPSVYIDPTRPTTLKQRFRADDKTLLRVSHLHQESIGSELRQIIKQEVRRSLPDTQVLIFSDFNYGCLPQELVTELIGGGQKNNVYMAADSQSSSQLGNVARFHDMHLLTPTEREARLSLRNQEDGLVVLGEKLSKHANAKHLFLKLGSEGMLLHARDDSNKKQTDRIPALNPHPRDVAGAGDSLLVLGALAIAVGASAWEAACLGSLAAAIQVSRIGNTPLRLDELQRELV